MTDYKKKVKNGQGNDVDATIVEIEESIERFTEIRLKEGTILKVKNTILEVVRLEQWDADGNPLYGVKAQNVLTIVNCPDDLKKSREQSA